ncbi:DUF2690 domain-containing protein [Streptomyces sp. NPDC007088]|uniref:helix-turn-helix domain-containing protein n=1 Tax=Streptomyces sp. NPDC007088 TaxID=3364773 RepID=UPI0036938E38
MSRWKALPDGLDPQIREFVSQLRRLADRGGLGVEALARRTGHSGASWERYLSGRLLAPRGAVVAFAEATGANPAHLTTMWELAERAWSRSEARHDLTMEAIRISQARAALGEPGPAPAAVPSYAGPEPEPEPETHVAEAGRRAGPVPGPDPGRPGGRGDGPGGPESAVPPGRGAGPGARRWRGRRRTVLFAGLAGVLVVLAAVLLLSLPGSGGDSPASAREPSATAPEASPLNPPAGVRCAGRGCGGRDPQRMGCAARARTTARARVGDRLVEVRYSRACRAAWARISRAGPGDEITVSAGSSTRGAAVEDDAEAYTPMVAAPEAEGARACATVGGGAKGCTTTG